VARRRHGPVLPLPPLPRPRARPLFANAADSAGDVGRAVNKAEDLADATKVVGKADNVGDAAKATAKADGIAGDPGQVARRWPADPKDLPRSWKKGAWEDLPESRGGGRQLRLETNQGNLVVAHTGHPKQPVHQTLHYHVYSPDPERPGRYLDRGTFFPGQIIEPWV